MRRLGSLLLALTLPAFAAEPEPDDLPKAPSEAKARIQNIEQELTDWDIDAAEKELEQLEKLAPPGVEYVSYLRGRVAFEQGRYADAVDALDKANLTDKPGSWLRLAKDTQRIVGAHEKVESEHFIFFYPKGKDSLLGPWALETLEKARAALEKDLGYAPPGKVRVEVVGSAAELSKVSTLSKEAIRTTGTIAICKFNKLMVTSPRAVIHGYDWLDTLAHEFTHLVVSKKSRNTVPIWMHEGLAKYLESRWRGPAGGAMTPSTLALLGSRVRKNRLVPFEKMHPSMALLPTAEDAATAFAEVFFAIELIDKEKGKSGLASMLSDMATGTPDKVAVEHVTRKSWPAFEQAWMAHLKEQPYPKELIPQSAKDKKELAENSPGKAQKEKDKKREISFGDFAEVSEVDARRNAHLGELMREHGRTGAAAEEYEKAWHQVGDRYESVSNKYALTLIELRRLDQAEKVLLGSLTMHPGSAQTQVHLARIAMKKKAWAKVRASSVEALAVDPFNEEIHLALYVAAEATGNTLERDRELAVSAMLLNVPKERVAENVRSLFSDELPHAEPPSDAGR